MSASGQVRGLADGGVVHVQIAADGAHDDLAGVQTDTDLHLDAVGAPDTFGVALHRLLHAKRGVAGAHRMVLMGQRRAEERHDSVPHHLVDRALVAVNRLHHVLEHGVEQLACLLGISIREKFHRSLQVSEEDRDLLPLTFQSGLGGEDLFGEVFGSVRLGRGETRWAR